MTTSAIEVAPAIRSALAAREPVVALETAVLTHGLPPAEAQAAMVSMQDAVRRGGARPAVVGVWRGALRIGLSDDEWRELGQADADKVSLASLPISLARGRPAGTTVATTVLGAAAAGIAVVATGGIGGIHRGWSLRPDLSADLLALASHRVAVVCAGPKAVLDVPATFEALETLGVPVLGLGIDEAPAFYHNRSGIAVAPIDHANQAAAVLRMHWQGLSSSGGAVVLNPVPAEVALEAPMVARVIDGALADAERRGVVGPATTPHLLNAVAQATEGASLTVNLAVLASNARAAAALAVALVEVPE